MIPPHTVRLEFGSAFDMLDFVQVVSDHVGAWSASTRSNSTGSASRCASRSSTRSSTATSATNKRVIVEFSPVPPTTSDELVIRVGDQGEGFDPEEVADPLAPENILKSSGRGIFLIRNFMDERCLPNCQGGMEMRMVKKLQKPALSPRLRRDGYRR